MAALGTTNISTDLINTTIGEGSNDVRALCVSTKINQWSKRKPISFNKSFDLTAQNYIDSNYGLIQPPTSTNYLTAYGRSWIYDRPSGGATSPYRLGDFRGYNHSADPILFIEESGMIVDINSAFLINFPFLISDGDTYSLSLKDLNGIGSMYVGAVYAKGSKSYIQTATLNIADGGVSFYGDPSSEPFSTIGKVKLYFVLSDTKFETVTELVSQTVNYLSVPYSTGYPPTIDIKVEDSELTYSILAAGEVSITSMTPIEDFQSTSVNPLYTQGDLFMKLKISNSGSSAKTLTGVFEIGSSRSFQYEVPQRFDATVQINGSAHMSSVVVPASSYIIVDVGVTHLLDRDENGSISILPPTGSNIHPTIKLYYNTVEITSTELYIECD